MRKVLFFIAVIFFSLSGIVWAWDDDDVYVRGYWRSDGTYVRPHYRSHPDGDVFNNWSTKGNINPYTGERGTKDPWTELNRRWYRDYNW